MSSTHNLTARGRREVGWKIGRHDLDRTSDLDSVEEDVDEIPALPTGNPNLLEVSVSFDSRESLESVLVASGLEKETSQCWECGGDFQRGPWPESAFG